MVKTGIYSIRIKITNPIAIAIRLSFIICVSFIYMLNDIPPPIAELSAFIKEGNR